MLTMALLWRFGNPSCPRLAASQGVGFSAGGLSHSGTKAASEQRILDTVENGIL